MQSGPLLSIRNGSPSSSLLRKIHPFFSAVQGGICTLLQLHEIYYMSRCLVGALGPMGALWGFGTVWNKKNGTLIRSATLTLRCTFAALSMRDASKVQRKVQRRRREQTDKARMKVQRLASLRACLQAQNTTKEHDTHKMHRKCIQLQCGGPYIPGPRLFFGDPFGPLWTNPRRKISTHPKQLS